jgi:hypothetical protein
MSGSAYYLTLERDLLLEEMGRIERSRTMKRLLLTLVVVGLTQPLSAAAQPPPPSRLASAIAEGTPFVVRLNPGEHNGTLIGGETYVGHYNRDSNTFTVSGPGLRDDGVVIPVTATYGGADPWWQELSVWGALYTFDTRGNLFLGTSGRLSGTVSLRR